MDAARHRSVAEHIKEKAVLLRQLFSDVIKVSCLDLTIFMVVPPLEHERPPFLVFRIGLSVELLGVPEEPSHAGSLQNAAECARP